jgi:hypothetical protein
MIYSMISFLAFRAEPGGATRLSDPHYRRATLASLFFVNPEEILEIPGLVVDPTEIRDAGAVVEDGLGQYLANGGSQPRALGSGQCAARCFGVDAGTEESLTGIDVADTGDEFLVEEQGLYRRRATAEPVVKARSGEAGGKRFDSHRLLFRNLRPRSVKGDPTKTAGIHQEQPATVPEFHPQAQMPDPFRGKVDHYLARHTEMEHDPPAGIGMQEYVLAEAFATDELKGNEFRDGGFHHSVREYEQADDGAAKHLLPQAIDHCLDFRQFGHETSFPEKDRQD